MNNKFVDTYVVFDTETTGLNDETDKIIEIGALKYQNNKLIEEFNILINPEIDIPEIITTITGINNKMVESSKTISEGLPMFLKFIGDLPLICHNTPFDMGFINKNLLKLNLKPLNNYTLDTIELAKIYIPKAYNYKLETLKKYFHLEFGSHRSIEDCKTTNYIYQECKKRALAHV